MRPTRNVLVATALLIGVVATPMSAEASGRVTAAECTFTTPMHFSPGISSQDGTGLLYASDENFSGAERGAVVCIGVLGGEPVTGPGTFGFTGKWTEGNCEANKGAGRYSFTVPTTGGTKHFVGRYAEERVGLNGTVRASQAEGTFTGAFHIIPTGTLTNQENCHQKPITRASIVIAGLFA